MLFGDLARLDDLAQASLPLWDMPAGAAAQRINVSENITYLVEAPCGWCAVLRLHREGYHTRGAIASELAWIAALRREDAVHTPGVISGRDGRDIQQVRRPDRDAPLHMVLFRHVPGAAPDLGTPGHEGDPGSATRHFETLGAIAARMHDHAEAWHRPDWFRRPAWDLGAVFGPAAPWGDWRAAPHVTPDARRVLERVETRLHERLAAFGVGPGRYGLIHADMRLANLLVTPGTGATHVIDFDDCGFGWYLYDFAAAVSFIEDDPRLPSLKAAWVRGYRGLRALPEADIAEMDSLIMLRRMALLAWVGSHRGAPEPDALAPDFARVTAELGQAWLDGLGQG